MENKNTTLEVQNGKLSASGKFVTKKRNVTIEVVNGAITVKEKKHGDLG